MEPREFRERFLQGDLWGEKYVSLASLAFPCLMPFLGRGVNPYISFIVLAASRTPACNLYLQTFTCKHCEAPDLDVWVTKERCAPSQGGLDLVAWCCDGDAAPGKFSLQTSVQGGRAARAWPSPVPSLGPFSRRG